jgi:hypothetical protein
MHQSQTNQSTTYSSRKFCIALTAAILLTALSSILVLAFKSNSYFLYRQSTSGGLVNPLMFLHPDPRNDKGDFTLALYPLHLDLGAIKPTLAGAGISLALTLTIALLSVFVRHRGKALLVRSFHIQQPSCHCNMKAT